MSTSRTENEDQHHTDHHRRSEDSLAELKRKITDRITANTDPDRAVDLMLQLEMVSVLTANTAALIGVSRKIGTRAVVWDNHIAEDATSRATSAAARPILLYVGRVLQGAVVAGIMFGYGVMHGLRTDVDEQASRLAIHIAVEKEQNKRVTEFLSLSGEERFGKRLGAHVSPPYKE